MPPADLPASKELVALQATVAAWDAKWADLSALRERIAVCEVKQAAPVVDDEDEDDSQCKRRVEQRALGAAEEGRHELHSNLRRAPLPSIFCPV